MLAAREARWVLKGEQRRVKAEKFAGVSFKGAYFICAAAFGYYLVTKSEYAPGTVGGSGHTKYCWLNWTEQGITFESLGRDGYAAWDAVPDSGKFQILGVVGILDLLGDSFSRPSATTTMSSSGLASVVSVLSSSCRSSL